MKTPNIVVVGSLNMDLVTTTQRRPAPGETLIGDSFAMFVGGKGLNQAIAAARQQTNVTMVGRVGGDDFGTRLRETLQREGINDQYVLTDESVSSGIATIVIDGDGDNNIIVVSGANGQLSPADIEAATPAIQSADLLMLQLEVPLESVLRAAQIARAAGVRVMLNPAPARELPDDLLKLVDIITPNETETALLTGIQIDNDQAADQAADALLDRGAAAAVLTLGARGALLADAQQHLRIPGYQVKVVDTTAAGDAFCAGLVAELGRGASLSDAIRHANATGALATTKLGAEPAMPQLNDVLALKNS
jgi:ribokinase